MSLKLQMSRIVFFKAEEHMFFGLPCGTEVLVLFCHILKVKFGDEPLRELVSGVLSNVSS